LKKDSGQPVFALCTHNPKNGSWPPGTKFTKKNNFLKKNDHHLFGECFLSVYYLNSFVLSVLFVAELLILG
jgi:hypothetical protein